MDLLSEWNVEGGSAIFVVGNGGQKVDTVVRTRHRCLVWDLFHGCFLENFEKKIPVHKEEQDRDSGARLSRAGPNLATQLGILDLLL